MNTILTQNESIVKPFEDIKDKFTQIHNFTLEVIMPDVRPSSWKVLCFILRKTYGWQKDADLISFSQIMKGTGIKNRTTIMAAIDELESKNYILVTRHNDNKTPNTYALNKDYKVVQKSDQLEGGSTEIGPEIVQKMDSQKKGLKKDSNNNTPESDLPEFPPLDPTFAKVSQLYKQEINVMFGSTTSDLLKDLANTYPLDWIEKAFKIAVKANARRLDYIEGILKRWQETGHPTLEKPKRTKAKEPETERIDENQYVEVVPEEESHELAVDESWLDEQFTKFREDHNGNS